jgi:hypothetical protein
MAPIPVEIAVGVAFLAAGLLAWRRRPENRTGLLLTLSGVAWFTRNLARSDAQLSTGIGELSLNVFLALIVHQIVVFPYGVAKSRSQRVVIVSAYALAFGGYVISEVFPSTNDALAALAIPILVAVLFLVVQRWLAASAPARRALEPIVWVGPPVLVVAIVTVLHDYLDIGSSTAIDWLKLAYIGIPLAFLAGVLRTTAQRAAVGDMVVELSGASSPAEVRDSLARTLGDPSLELAFRLPNQERYVDGRGRTVAPPDNEARGVTELDGVVLVYDPSLRENQPAVQSAAAAAQLALDNARLQAELRAQLERRRESEDGQLRVDFVTAPKDADSLAELTTRELEVLTLIAEGRTDRGIAQALYVTPKTVEAHVRSIFRKLDLPADSTLENRRVHAVLTFLRTRA